MIEILAERLQTENRFRFTSLAPVFNVKKLFSRKFRKINFECAECHKIDQIIYLFTSMAAFSSYPNLKNTKIVVQLFLELIFLTHTVNSVEILVKRIYGREKVYDTGPNPKTYHLMVV